MITAQAFEDVLYISAGDFYCDVNRRQIRTTLGSCVAVCAWHKKSKRAAMVHYLLPYKSNKYSSKGDNYFADKVLPKMVRKLIRYGALQDYSFYAYGGGSFIGGGFKGSSIGAQNILFLRKWATAYDIQFVNASLGGECCRVVTLNGATGEVILREKY